MRGEISSGTFAKRHPLDWYAEETWVTRQLFEALDGFADDRAQGLAIWDPAAGFGHTCHEFAEAGFECWLSDVVENVDWSTLAHSQGPAPRFFHADFTEAVTAPAPCTIVCNPPYSYIKGIAETFARRALALASGRVCLLLPIKWLATQVRHRLFREFPPAVVLVLTQRPSMPPGDRIGAMGKRAFRGGMIDYCWIVWDVRTVTAPGATRMVWLPPLFAGAPDGTARG